MSAADWIVLVGTLGVIAFFGVYKARSVKTAEEHMRGGRELDWITVGLSVMATQASAITFISGPGQAFSDGMGFVQIYLGLPLAMILISALMVPTYFRLQVYTAYEYLERRFDLRMRLLTAALFLVQRGLAAGITIYAPAILLSSVLGWSLNVTNAVIGLTVIVYTVTGGSRAVAQTQKQQMAVILVGMMIAAGILIAQLPESIGVGDAARLAGATGRMNVVDLQLDFSTRYNVWSGLLGGFFLALSYFGTDQSQVQRYLGAQSIAASRMGLLFNGVLKIPMQFGILFVGVLLFVHYLFAPSPMIFDEPLVDRLEASPAAAELTQLQGEWDTAWAERRDAAEAFAIARDTADEPAARATYVAAVERSDAIRDEARALAARTVRDGGREDTDFVFLHFILNALPAGLVGLLLAVLLCAAMSSTASELSALGTTTTVDFYKRVFRPNASDVEQLRASRIFTALWGLIALGFASWASLFDNLIEAVNILGSIFYGSILGIFLTAFLLKRVHARAVFYGALVAQSVVLLLVAVSDVAFLWYNVVGCVVVMITAPIFQRYSAGAGSST
ncbi:sodium:solute symporter [Sandaracinus amylolyticus]|uniref:Sodium iodide symporter n=1 Tax=Sandaracinus amylolyticus TaxID=927083 RepID=A0A0F6VZG4_9BACT|nr:sodium:solute symporter [Sandaracinus amylolyticus]AKF03556.1 Sodium iodide symporter [Sandaracinus amylolyticus]